MARLHLLSCPCHIVRCMSNRTCENKATSWDCWTCSCKSDIQLCLRLLSTTDSFLSPFIRFNLAKKNWKQYLANWILRYGLYDGNRFNYRRRGSQPEWLFDLQCWPVNIFKSYFTSNFGCIQYLKGSWEYIISTEDEAASRKIIRRALLNRQCTMYFTLNSVAHTCTVLV